MDGGVLIGVGVAEAVVVADDGEGGAVFDADEAAFDDVCPARAPISGEEEEVAVLAGGLGPPGVG